MNNFALSALGLSHEDDTNVTLEININPEETIAEDELALDESADAVTEAEEGSEELAETEIALEALHDKLTADLGAGRVLTVEAHAYAAGHFASLTRKFPGMAGTSGVTVSQEDFNGSQVAMATHKAFTLTVEEAKEGFGAGIWKAIKALFQRIVGFFADLITSKKRLVGNLEAVKAEVAKSAATTATVKGAVVEQLTASKSGAIPVSFSKMNATVTQIAKIASANFELVKEISDKMKALPKDATAEQTKAVEEEMALAKTFPADVNAVLPGGARFLSNKEQGLVLAAGEGKGVSEVTLSKAEMLDVLGSALTTLSLLDKLHESTAKAKTSIDAVATVGEQKGLKAIGGKFRTFLIKRAALNGITKVGTVSFRACRLGGQLGQQWLKAAAPAKAA